jgi:DNA segregation ATPase FtsK/SpoIIIE, S-DNA-T family
VLAVDECQIAFEHPTYGADIQTICEDLVRRFPVTGIMPLFATQRPDAKSLPTGISANAVLRFCLKVMDDRANNMVLGSGMYAAGVRATMFARGDKGIGYLAGEGDDPQIVRTYYLDAPAAERIIARARTAREQAGTLSGHALGERFDAPDAPRFDLLGDLLAVVPTGEAKVWNETVVARLAELRPDSYQGWAAEQLTVALKPYGVPVGQVWGTTPDGQGANRRGITRADLTTAAQRRRHQPPTEAA